MDNAEGKTASSFVKEFRSLVAKNVKGNMQIVSRLNQLVRSAGAPSRPERQQSGGKQAALLTRLMDFNLASYEVISSYTLGMLNDLVSAAETSLLGREPHSAAASPRASGEIQAKVRQGERLKAPFVVENLHSDPVEISFEAGELTALAVPSVPASNIGFEPAAFTLAPQKKAVVAALVDVSEAFVVGKTYRSSIRVLGFQGQEVRLALTVLPPAEAGKPAQKPSDGKRKRAPRGRRAKGAPPARSTRVQKK